MKQCTKCGNNVNDNVKFCNSCGAPIEDTVNSTSQQPNQANDFVSKIADLNNTADTTAEYDPKDIEDNKILALFSYLSLLVLIPILAAPNSRYARFHANQGLVLLIIEVAWAIIQTIITTILFSISWHLAFIASILSIVYVLFVILIILGIINAVTGKAKELPVIGKFRILK